jgi:FkbM family methyltransferase
MNSRNISKKIIEYYLPPNPIIVEAGAHIGRDTRKMNIAWPTSTIHAFEPVPELFAILSHNVLPNSNIFCYPLALSNITGITTLFMSSGRSTATSSLLEPTKQFRKSDTIFTPIEIQTTTLDDWAQKYYINRVDCLWLDMQGAELLVLKASPTLLKTVSVIYTEVNFIQRYKGMPLYPEIKQWLIEQGFTIVHEACKSSDWGNILCVRLNK